MVHVTAQASYTRQGEKCSMPIVLEFNRAHQHLTSVSHNLSNKLTSEDAETTAELDIHLAFKYFSKQQDYNTSLQC